MVKCQKNVKIIVFSVIFWDILDKRESNVGQECVTYGLLTFHGKFGTTAPEFSGKITVFSSFGPTFPPVPP